MAAGCVCVAEGVQVALCEVVLMLDGLSEILWKVIFPAPPETTVAQYPSLCLVPSRLLRGLRWMSPKYETGERAKQSLRVRRFAGCLAGARLPIRQWLEVSTVPEGSQHLVLALI